MSIVAAESIETFFDEVVEDAIKARGVDASETATRYLVGVLAEPHLEAFGRPLALSLQEALVTPEPAERFSRLRQLGDAVLYASGFFADHFAARGLESRYVFSIGSRAYVSAGALLGGSGVLEELAAHFDQFASVLLEVADRTVATNAMGVLKLYERGRLSALAAHGLFAMRGPKGVQ